MISSSSCSGYIDNTLPVLETDHFNLLYQQYHVKLITYNHCV
ncbi:hypothetical protein RG47T_2203 [Mucilaginibacter polytrichastri]|uniref:Uncharacterized protein n=1 Tax=Mucilaginibacter polytrichastri TaxID=1302689 RepID=A0A1Q5ZYB2_9SPHI|nr:hypothetical protein RG47T_2203 [Mucilaginibacter polytrichastri]